MIRLDGRQGGGTRTPCEPHGRTPRPESPAHPIVLMATLLFTAAVSFAPAQQPAIAPAPVPGPVGLSVGNEARSALLRAERWLRRNDPGPGAEQPAPVPPDAAPCDAAGIDRLLPLLQGLPLADPPGGPGENRYEACLRLAHALCECGAPTVFLPDGTSIPWRNALLHELAASQHPDDRGGGWWSTLPEPDPDDTLRSTRAATAALLYLLGAP